MRAIRPQKASKKPVKKELSASELVDMYIETKKGSWADNTLYAVSVQLKSIPSEILLGNDGNALFQYLTKERKLKPYSTKINFTRAAGFIKWAVEEGRPEVNGFFNNFQTFIKHNRKLFSRVYVPKRVGHSVAECMKRIARMTDEEARKKAMQLLTTGMRWEESFTLKDGIVVGKGGARRQVHTATPEDENVRYSKTYHTFRKELLKVGLKPHDLRKAFATYIVSSQNMNLGELMAYMGWQSTQAAGSYIQSVREEQVTKSIREGMQDLFKKVGGKK